jgi:hypothetical protein
LVIESGPSSSRDRRLIQRYQIIDNKLWCAGDAVAGTEPVIQELKSWYKHITGSISSGLVPDTIIPHIGSKLLRVPATHQTNYLPIMVQH